MMKTHFVRLAFLLALVAACVLPACGAKSTSNTSSDAQRLGDASPAGDGSACVIPAAADAGAPDADPRSGCRPSASGIVVNGTDRCGANEYGLTCMDVMPDPSLACHVPFGMPIPGPAVYCCPCQ